MLGAWLDERTGWRALAASARRDLGKPVPRHVGVLFSLGTVAGTLLLVLLATGLLLAFRYRASPEGAFESLETLVDRVPAGWLVRSLHVWAADFLVLALALHAIRVFLFAGYKRPRELTWVLGVAILGLVLAEAFTGSVLPWNQRGYWATTIATEMTRALPLLGEPILSFLVGGSAIGEATLPRFFAFHALALPPLLLVLVGAHLALVRRLGVSTLEDVDVEIREGHDRLVAGGEPFFPHHVLREALVVNVVIALLLACALLWPPDLGDEANPFETPPGVKPEWYFLPFYQLQKYVPPRVLGLPGNAVGSMLAPLPFLALLLLPFLDRSPARRARRRKAWIALGLSSVLATVLLGALGHLADRRVHWFGREIEFDSRAIPRFAAGEIR